MALPARNHRITLAEAARHTRRHREQNPQAEKGGAFHADQVRALLAQPGAEVFRYYHGIHDDGRYAMVLVASTVRGEDLVDGIMMEEHLPCPPWCPLANDLNTSDPAVARLQRAYRTAPVVLPARDHSITTAEAAVLTRRWRLTHRDAERSGAFHADQVRRLLDERECVGLRYYHGLDEAGRPSLILVGMDLEGADMTDHVMLEEHLPCPPWCPMENDLNSSAWVARRRIAVAAAAPR
jgi:hypothetical protein